MPITKSAIKKARQDVKARKHNRAIRVDYKEAAKEVKKFALAGDLKKAQEALKKAYSELDKAAKRNVLHKNNASRRKSRLSEIIVKAKGQKAEKPKKEENKSEK